MSEFEVTDNNVTTTTKTGSAAYVPPLQCTAGQPPPTHERTVPDSAVQSSPEA